MKIPPFGSFVFPPTLPMTHLASCLTLTGRPWLFMLHSYSLIDNSACLIRCQRQCQYQAEFLSWLVIAIVISESTKAYKSKNRTIVIYQGRICGKEMSSDADWRSVKTRMIVYIRIPEGESSMWWLQQLEATGDRQLTVGEMRRAVGIMSISEVGDGLEGLRNGSTGINMVAQAHEALGTPWQQPWNLRSNSRQNGTVTADFEVAIQRLARRSSKKFV